MFSIEQQTEFLKKAAALTPKLKRWPVYADALVTPVEDKSVWQNYRMEPSNLDEFLANNDFASGNSFIVKLPETTVGQLAFTIMSPCGYADSPSRLRITLGELPQEVVNATLPYNGTLNGSWLQTEIINIDNLPAEVVLPRRYSCKYIRFEMMAVPQKIRISNIHLIACGAEDKLLPPAEGVSSELQAIDVASMRTLRNCMQTTFEDGPKRDRRLWLGDLRLQAKVNKVTYKRYDIVERSLYMLAGCLLPDGEVCGCVMEHPKPRKGCHTHDYTMLFAATLEEHCRWSGNLAIGHELFDLAVYQMELMERFFDNGLFVTENDPYVDWFFIDHDDDLERQASMQAHAVFAYKSLARLAKLLGKNNEAEKFAKKADKLTIIARKHFYNEATGLVESGKNKQISFASQIWMIIAGVLTPEEGVRALQTVEKMPSARRPSSPYMFHYLLEAWMICGEEEHVMELIKEYYGSMLKHGADTFWEAYRPDEPFFSPYNDVRMNSACHAWSGTASYFIRECRS